SETLTAVLRFSAKRLLRDERVGTNRARVNFVRDQVTELHHIDVANDDFLIESVAGPAIEQFRLAGFLNPAETILLLRVFEVFANLAFLNSGEHWSRDFESERLGCDAEVRFQNLTDVHSARHAEWIQHDLNRSSVREERHVFFRNDARNHALVSVASRHFIA